MRGFIVGKEVTSYISKEEKNKPNPQSKISRTLYVVWDKPRRSVEGMEGFKAEAVWVPFSCDDIKVGDYCEFEYEARNTSKGSFASLVDIIVIGKADILLEASKAKA
ncbi:MAG: hypothetical protein IJX39_06050 [Clostridia bacterium]|nr:hypothetical protein [Clostridia bacterium]